MIDGAQTHRAEELDPFTVWRRMNMWIPDEVVDYVDEDGMRHHKVIVVMGDAYFEKMVVEPYEEEK